MTCFCKKSRYKSKLLYPEPEQPEYVKTYYNKSPYLFYDTSSPPKIKGLYKLDFL